MDVLSEVLSTVRLQGALFFNAEFSAPWCLNSSGSRGIAPYLPSNPGHIILFHFLTEGRAYAQLDDQQEVELSAGDIVILPHGDPHLIGNGSPRQPVDSFRTFQKHLADGLRLVRYGGGGEITRFVCGYMVCDPRLSDLFLAGLPRLVRVQVANGPSGEWIRNSIRFSVGAMEGSDAGSSLVVARLSEVLFVETLRGYINSLPENQTGWLAGARDASVGKALAFLHKEPAHPWTVPTLAHRVGLSRTRLAERFRYFLGTSPMAYLTDWRLKLGAEILESSQDSVAQIADAVGYQSEAAFNRAFKRAFGCPPAKYRLSQKAQAPSMTATSMVS
jgi:AraC-like DNA-binding protein